MSPPALLPGPDGAPRCAWACSAGDYLAYHDEEWGRPLHGDDQLFERLSLEAFQAGLSWLLVLRRRPALRESFAGFHIPAVARLGDADVSRLAADPRLIRNRAKIAAVVGNARAALALPGGLSRHVWSFAPPARPRPRSAAEVPASTAESGALAADLRHRGFRFVGPTTAYSLMQAVGMVDDHLAGCAVPARRGRVSARGS